MFNIKTYIIIIKNSFFIYLLCFGLELNVIAAI